MSSDRRTKWIQDCTAACTGSISRLRVLKRAREGGEITKDVRVCDLLTMTVGALFYNRWSSREPLTDGFIERLLDYLFWALLLV